MRWATFAENAMDSDAPAAVLNPSDDGPRRRGLIPFLGLLFAYGLAFALLGRPWLLQAEVAVPVGAPADIRDQQIVVFVLSWIARVLAGEGAALMDLPIHHPASGQLTGSEHFATSQLVFAPLYYLTGNALLAANLTVFATYPLAAAVMHLLLRQMGTSGSVAVVGALTFSLGPLRVPAHMHTLQYANFYLPWIALALSRLRTRANIGGAAWLGIALLAGLFSSYYAAVMAVIVGGLWGAFELARPAPGRRRFAFLALTTAVACGVLLVLASAPYFERPEAGRPATIPSAHGLRLLQYAAMEYAMMIGVTAGALALLGVFALRQIGAPRRLARRGLCIGAVGGILMFGSAVQIGELTVLMPWSLTALLPLSFFRFPPRLVVVLGFGVSLLVAAGLEMMSRRAGPRWGPLCTAALAVIILVSRGGELAGADLLLMPEQVLPIYGAVGKVANEHGRGPLLELPITRSVATRDARAYVDASAMIGATRHHLPLVGGFTGHTPPHRTAIETAVRRLPEKQSLQLLVDMTRVRWILLRPEREWPKRSMRRGLIELPQTELVLSRDGFDLLRVDMKPRDARVHDLISRGFSAGTTALGTPLTPIPESAAAGAVRGEIGASVKAGGRLKAKLVVVNLGTAPWPVLFSQWRGVDHRVRLGVRWHCRDRGCRSPEESSVQLPWDVLPGAAVVVRPVLIAPDSPGEYDLEIRPKQTDGALFSAESNRPFVARVQVLE